MEGIYLNQNDFYSADRGLEEVPNNKVNRSYSVGRIVKVGKSQYRITPAERNGSCVGCDLYKHSICYLTNRSICCSAYSRLDKDWVILKKINKEKDGTTK